jgi:hypothetical protein
MTRPFSLRADKDGRLVDFNEACVDDGAGGRVLPSEIKSVDFCLTMPSPPIVVSSGLNNHVRFLIFQPPHSARKFADVTSMYWTMEPAPKFSQLRLRVKTRADF